MPTRSEPYDNTAILNVASLLRQDLSTGGEVEASGSFMPDAAWHTDEVNFEKPLEFDIAVRSAGGDDFLLTGKVHGEAIMPCRRCLEGVEVSSQSDFVYSMQYRPGREGLEMVFDDEEDEVLVFGRPEVDFAQMMTEIFTVDLPLAVECPEGVTCEPLSERYRQSTETPTSPFSSLEDFDVDSKE